MNGCEQVEDPLPTSSEAAVSPSSPRFQSIIWNYYTRSEDGHICRICGQVLSFIQKNVNKLRRHLQLNHKNQFRQVLENDAVRRNDLSTKKYEVQSLKRKIDDLGFEEYRKSTQPVENQNNTSITSDKAFMNNSKEATFITDTIIEMMVRDLLPLNIVEGSGFKQLLHVLKPTYQIPEKTIFSERLIPQLYEALKNKMVAIIQSDLTLKFVDSVTITVDVWSLSSAENFVSLRLHYMTHSFEFKHFVLETFPLIGEINAQVIVSMISQTMINFKIPEDFESVSFVFDNADNLRLAIHRPNWLRVVGCFSHSLQLAIRDAEYEFDGLQDLKIKVKTLIAGYTRSSKARENLAKWQRKLGKPLDALVTTNDMRWISDFYMIKRVVEQKDSITNDLRGRKRPRENLIQKEWDMAESYVQVLSPLAGTVVDLCSDEYPSRSVIIPLLYGIEKTLKNEKESSEMCKKFSECLLRSIQHRFTSYMEDEELLATMVVDPRFKAVLLKPQQLLKANKQLKYIQTKILKNSPDEDVEIRQNPSSSVWEVFDHQFNKSSNGESGDRLDEEFNIYLSEHVLRRSLNMHDWWSKTGKVQFPVLSKVARYLLSIPATQASSKRLFSPEGDSSVRQRNSLPNEQVAVMGFLHENVAFNSVNFNITSH